MQFLFEKHETNLSNFLFLDKARLMRFMIKATPGERSELIRILLYELAHGCAILDRMGVASKCVAFGESFSTAVASRSPGSFP